MTNGEKESTNLSLDRVIKAIANQLAKARGQTLSEHFESLVLAELARTSRRKARPGSNEAAKAHGVSI